MPFIMDHMTNSTQTTSTGTVTGALDPEISAELTLERRDLLQTLATHREFLRTTARDLTDEQAAHRSTVSALCIGGLIKHVAYTESGWADFIVHGPSALAFSGEADYVEHAASFRMEPGETLASILERYDAVARRTDDLVATIPDLDRSHPLPGGTLVRARRQLVGPPRVPPHRRRDSPTRRPRRHPPRVDRRFTHDGLTRPADPPCGERTDRPPVRSLIAATVDDPPGGRCQTPSSG